MAPNPQVLTAAVVCCLMLLAIPVNAQTGAATGAAPAASSLSRALPLRREEPTAPASLAPAVAGGVLLVAAAAAGLLLARRKGVQRMRPWLPVRTAAAPITRVASQALTQQASVHAIQWNGEELLLACTPQHVTLLARRPLQRPEEPE